MMKTHSAKQEKVFNQLYKKYYGLFFWRCEKAVKDDLAASGMVNDAFLRVWLLRDHLQQENIYDFLKGQLKKAIFSYYDLNANRFHSQLFRLDDFDNFDFMLPISDDDEETEQPAPDLGVTFNAQWLQVQQVIHSLPIHQQQLINLCLKYNFSYGEISHYLGGLSDYAVGKKVTALLTNLKAILTDHTKLQVAHKNSHVVFSEGLDVLQQEILRMRYELAYTFKQMANALGLSEKEVKVAFARASKSA